MLKMGVVHRDLDGKCWDGELESVQGACKESSEDRIGRMEGLL